MPQCRGASARQLFLQAAVAYTRVHCTRSHLATASMRTGTVCTLGHPQAHAYSLVCRGQPAETSGHPPHTRTRVQWFVNHCLFNSITRGPAAGLASCLEVDLHRRLRPLACLVGREGSAGSTDWIQTVPWDSGRLHSTQSFPVVGTTQTLGLMENRPSWGPPLPQSPTTPSAPGPSGWPLMPLLKTSDPQSPYLLPSPA